jgi:ABC-type branched-subunit amino acid transport system substrate-binding protein
MHVSKRAKALSVGAAALLVLTACGSQDEGSSSGDETTASSEPMKFGYVLPETGDLAFLGPPQIEAAKFAISQINDAGGVLGMDVPDIVSGDEAGDQAIASQSADRVLNSGVNVVIGAAASGMSLAIIDKVTGAGVAQCSGSNTAPTFTDYSDNGLYFRTAPSDALQGPILGDVIVGDGHSNVAIVARADDYGKGLADATATALEGSGATVALNESYDPKSTNFDSVVQKVSAAEPDAVVVIAFEEGTQILSGLIEAGLTADKVGLYGADGLRNTDLGSLVSPDDPSVIDGMKGTAPASADNPDFVTSLEEFAPELEQTQFAPQVFDCVTIMALAAEQAKSTTAEDFKDVVNGITKDGEKCDTFADCKKLIDEGTDIDYDGVSGPLDFTDAGEPGSATIEVYGFSDGGTFETISTETSQPAQ